MSKQSSLEFLQSLSEATTELVEKTVPSVVSVGSGRSRGSGVVWNSEGYIVTASHVVGRSETIEVGLGDRKRVKATVVGRDPYYDVAVLKVENGTFHPIEQGDVEKVKVGNFVLGLANPFNQQAGATSGIVTGVGSKLQRRRGPPLEDIIVTDARLNPGYSGGPLIDGAGKMIGLNVAVIWSRGIAIPVNRIQRIVKQLVSNGMIKRSYLGITFQSIPLPSELSKQRNIDQEGGAIIFSVEAESPAKEAGLTLGDVIIKFDDKPVESAHDLPRVLTEDYIGKATKLTILRGGKLKELTVTPVAKDSPN